MLLGVPNIIPSEHFTHFITVLDPRCCILRVLATKFETVTMGRSRAPDRSQMS